MPRTFRAPGPAVPKADAALLLKVAAKRDDMASRPQSRSARTARAPGWTVPKADADPLLEQAAKREDMATCPQVALCKHRTKFPMPTPRFFLNLR